MDKAAAKRPLGTCDLVKPEYCYGGTLHVGEHEHTYVCVNWRPLAPAEQRNDLPAPLGAQPQANPVPVHISCPKCGAPHIDEGEWATRPHKTHQCQNCKHEWRPFPYATVGVSPAGQASTWERIHECTLELDNYCFAERLLPAGERQMHIKCILQKYFDVRQ